MELNEGGRNVMTCWNEIPFHYQKVRLHPFVIMPNHVHGIIEITSVPHPENSNVGVQYFEPLQNDHPHGVSRKFNSMRKNLRNQYQHIIPGSIGSIVRGFEIGVTKWFRKNTEIHNVWQRNYHDTIIRSERSFQNISKYIINNPKNWDKDEFNKEN
jgi:putative transposase